MAKNKSDSQAGIRRFHHIGFWLLVTVAVFIISFFILASTVYAIRIKNQNRLWPGLTIASLPVGGLTTDEAKTLLRQKVDDLNSQGLSFVSAEKTVIIHPITIAADDPDISSYLIDWQIDETVNFAYTIGRSNIIKSIADLTFIVNHANLPVGYSWNKTEINNILIDSFEGLLNDKKEAQLYFNNGQPKISSQATGVAFNFQRALDRATIQLAYLNNKTIVLEKNIEQPILTQQILEPLLPEVNKVLDFSQYSVNFENQEYIIKPRQLQDWLTFASNQQGQPYLTIDQIVFNEWVDSWSSQIEAEVQNAKFNLTDSRVTEFQPNIDGVKINRQELLQNMHQNLYQYQNITLTVEIIKPQFEVADVNDLGIIEILGTGISDFSGSPANRRHNIKIGADTLNGIIIPPGEEFSLLEALGEIDGQAGYLQELVIKGDKTIPEFGGGLCQIGTTTFRATLSSGLPITQRRNHSYRVAYYEPAGTDATIYNPWPDYRFKNDTGHHILIQTRMEDDKLYFDFWGTKDGRQIEQTDPVIYNITKPGPTKYIETTDLPVGEIKCTESAHNGADAYFDYTVTYPDDTVQEERFQSHYVPWREVCLIGVEEITQPEENEELSGSNTGDVIVNSLN